MLVHGAFADASSWAGVIPILQAAGVNVLAPPNPLRGINHDAAYIASVASQIPGPVLLVGHSYGGAVITNAGNRAITCAAWSTSARSSRMRARRCRTWPTRPPTAKSSRRCDRCTTRRTRVGA